MVAVQVKAGSEEFTMVEKNFKSSVQNTIVKVYTPLSYNWLKIGFV